MKSIAFVIPYFGPFPFWMDYFLESCRANPSVDFLFYSDNPAPSNWPDNIRYREMSFGDYKRLVSEKLEINFNPDNPYKLCDIKPSYGWVHRDELSNYDYWGFCDIDLVFGQIRNIVTEEILDKHDFFSAYDRRVSGHFFLCKNTPECSQAFKQAKDWIKIFEDKEHYCWDEKAFSDLFIKFKNHPEWSKKMLSWLLLPLSRRAYFKEQFSTPGLRYDWVDGSRNFPTEWYWRNGTLTNNGAEGEFLYFHFLKWKRDWDGNAAVQVDESGTGTEWKISARGFERL